MRQNRILISVDALFDTRIGLLLQHHPNYHSRLNMDAYRSRITDGWLYQIGWDMEDFDKKWESRDIEALKQSEPTVLLKEGLWSAIEERFVAAKIGMPEEKPTVTINFWPYKLSEEESVEFVKQLMNLYPEISFKYGTWDDEHLNPTYLRKHWDAMIVYDWYRWIKVNAENLKNRIPKFVIYRPGILAHETVPEAIEGIMAEKSNPFNVTKQFMAEYVCLETLKSELFSC